MRGAAALVVAVAACGRIAFDPRSDGGGDGGGTIVDADFGDAPMMATSCVGLPATCGPDANEDCCTTLPVPGGTFFRSYDVSGDGLHGMMNAPATVSSFWLDKYEVTVGRYRRFLGAGGGVRTNPPSPNAGARTLNGMAAQGGWQTAWNAELPADAQELQLTINCDVADQTWTDTPGANENLPMSCLSWYDAMAFCIWDGGFLPTEAEWNHAAAGGAEQRAYPWSSPAGDLTISCEHANFYNGATYCTDPPMGFANRVGSESPLGDGRWGHSDLAGNLWEWTLDWNATYATPCVDCADLTTQGSRVTRGGYFKNQRTNLRTGARSQQDPATRVQHVGVRCARN